MAARENQVFQGALIVCVLLVVALGASSYYFFSKSETKTKEAASANQQVTNLNRSLREQLDKVQFLEHLLGFKPLDESSLESVLGNLTNDSEVKAMYDKFLRDADNYGADLPPEERKDLNYTEMAERLVAANRELTDQLDQRDRTEVSLKSDVQLAQQKRDDDTKTIQAAHDQLSQELKDERQKFNDKYAAVQKSNQDMQGQLTQLNQQVEQEIAKRQQTSEELNKQYSLLEQQYIHLKEKLDKTTPSRFEVADGVVTWVNQRSNTVWINLGSADGLRRQVTFSVFDKDETTVSEAVPKGSIEVTRVIESHLSEAKILEDDVTNPILARDQIFSPAWRPGRSVRFALAGTMDIDEDGRDDRTYVRNLILANGGVIDAELLDSGEIKGAMTVNTRYLVKGERPTEKTGPNVQAGYSRLIDDANAFGVEQISLDKLLSYMGSKGTEKTIELGSGNADDYRGKEKKPVEPGDQFRERRPPQRGENGAF